MAVGSKPTRKSIAIHTCPLCKVRLPMGKKMDHFKAVHPEYKISTVRVDKDHTGYKCELCGQVLGGFKQIIDHFTVTHPLTERDISPGEAWLDELIVRLEQRKALLKENKRLTEENEQLKMKVRELTEKLVRFQRLMSQPER